MLAAAFGKLAVASLVASIWTEGTRHDLALAATGFMLKAGAPADVVTGIMRVVVEEFDAGSDQADRLRAIEDTVAKFEHDPASVTGAQKLIELLPGTAQAFMKKVAEWLGLRVARTDAVQAAKAAARKAKPVIYVSADQYDVTTDEAYGYLVAGNVDANGPILFQRAGELQRVRRAPDHRGVARPFITPVGLAAMRERLMRVADWIGGQDPTHAVPVQVPEFIASNILQKGEWPGVPLLRDITETPVITASGQIVVAPGYQAESQLWYCPAAGFEVPPVADIVTKDMAMAARDAPLDLLGDFIFEDEASRAQAFAYLLLPFLRELIDGPTPLHGISAPRRGTGKGLLTDIGALIATGKPARTFSWKDDDAELAKTITSFLIANAGGVLGIDNMDGTVASGVFARLLTSTVWSERLLGTNNISGGGGVPNRAVWFVNGNNIGFSDEIERRTVYIRLLTDRENPETRSGFRHPKLREYVLAERGRLVHAALTLARYAYQLREAGLPARQLLGSFEAYDELMGGLLEGLEVPGWMGNRAALRSQSTDEVEAWRELVCLWDIQRWGSGLPAGAVYERARVANVLPERLVATGALDMTREFGKALAKLDGQVIGPYRLVSRIKSGRRLYALAALKEGAAARQVDEVEGVYAASVRVPSQSALNPPPTPPQSHPPHPPRPSRWMTLNAGPAPFQAPTIVFLLV